MNRRLLILLLALTAALAVFNVQWVLACGARTGELKNLGMWCHTVTASLLLMFPAVVFRRLWPSAVLTAIAYLVMLANLLYLRTFGSWIPWGSYFAAGNLADFADAVIDSFRPADALMPLILVVGFGLASRFPAAPFSWRRFAAWVVALLIAVGVTVAAFNREEPMADKLRDLRANHNAHALAASRFSLPVVTVSEALSAPKMTKANRARIRRAMARRVTSARTSRFDNLVVIFMESLEGWTAGLSVDGRELTPTLNALMADTANLCVPRLLHDTGTGRSIDAQLLLLSGLIPSRDRIFAFAYPGNSYPSIYKALKEKCGDITVRSFTTDHGGIYNLARIAPQFGVDSLYCWPGAPGEGRRGKRGRRMPDGDFFRRVEREVDSCGLWNVAGGNVLQLATYTCHSPFRPVPGHRFPSPAEWPSEVRNYLSVVNYTDAALGEFLGWLRRKPGYERTLVVIMGDHPAFGAERRAELSGYVAESAEPSVPLLILNGGKADFRGSARQIDVYPTLISLLGLADYGWHGLGVPLCGPPMKRPRGTSAISSLILSRDLLRPH